ncbi:ubiquitin carboxyl-terminal hydrolase CYLD isoform X2 [Etheostoma cragini]|uniref:ubiquitin carboxyl-terminal hydrolase CYLD isoform X2 n=1 Tax=Etheostoma cragini TaxID=417921 RepID=UPI00155DE3A0|nr:ubiquitin carboxyl-terminal hydrolase CYLD isoform X2 [Etheostoma cragini]
MTSTENLYFIIIIKPKYPGHIDAGRICYISEHKHRLSLRRSCSPLKLPVFLMGARSSLDYELEVSSMAKLSAEEAELLQALSDDAERLKWFNERDALRTARGLTLGTEVTVEEGGEKLRGILRCMVRDPEPTYAAPISEKFFGIELQEEDKRKVKTSGSFRHKPFSCHKDCDIFAPFSRVRPVGPSSLSPSSPAHSQIEELSPGDRVTYLVRDTCRHGMVVDVVQNVVRISTDTDENGKRGGEVDVPLDMVIKGEVPAEPGRMDVDTPPVEPNADDMYLDLSVNSLVEVNLMKGRSYGIIRWIGSLPNRQETMAGLELEEDIGVTDGTFKDQRFFACPPKRALFVKLSSCCPDSRFQSTSANHSKGMPKQEDTEREVEPSAGKLDTVPPISTEQVNQILIGRMKGIQGHCNSCYMDAALFSLFSCSSVLDSMLFKSTEPQDAPIQRTLLHDIVNPLRSKGFVEGRHIMKLRKQLQNHGYSHSFTTDEKDPEEFLTVIMHHILALDPLLKLSAAGKVQESYCYQIFLDQNHSLVLPTVQQLLEHSFHTAGLKLAEVPSCLILQMPRFGKKFKMFDKIIPSLELDITDLLSEGPQQCMLCGDLAQIECPDCFTDPLFSRTGFKVFCKTCSSQVHSHPQRRSHQLAALDVPKGYSGTPHSLVRDKLELFAVLCIETSHYVSFIKHGPSSNDWIFFDSMADREGERDGFNIPEVHACPEVGKYLEMSPAELANQVPRDMEGVAKRLFCDAYMYLYQSTNMCLYR